MRRPCTRPFLTCTTRRWIRMRHSADHRCRSSGDYPLYRRDLSNGVTRLSDERPRSMSGRFFVHPGVVRFAVRPGSCDLPSRARVCALRCPDRTARVTHRFNRARACAICRFNRARDPFRIRMWQLFSFSWRLSAFRKIGDGDMPGHKSVA